jgi:hypothetical protein
MTDTDFEPLKNDNRHFPGPRAFLVSGYNSQEVAALTAFLLSLGYNDVPVRPCSESQLNDTLESVLSSDSQDAPAADGALPHVIVCSGMTSADVQTVMRGFSRSGLTRPVFATTTPTNMTFTLKELLRHLLEEQRAALAAMQNRKQKQGQ